MPYDEDQIANLEAELGDLSSPSTEDVLFYSEDYDAWIAAAIALRMALAGGGGGGGGSQDLASVLAEGNDADGVSIENLAEPSGDSDADTKGARNAAIAALASVYFALANLDTDGTLAANSDAKVASQKAVRTYVAAQIAALIAAAPGALDTLDELAAALGDDANFASTVTTALSGKQPLDGDLTAIAALTTTSFGRALLALADQAALLAAAGAAAATHAHAGEDITSGTVADARIASTIARDSEVTSAVSALSSVYQPLDSDLTAIAALTTTSYGRALLALADGGALLAAAGFTMSGAAAPNEFLLRPVTFNGVVDPKWFLGYNAKSTVATEPRYLFGVEGKYYDGVDTWNEFYVEQNWPGGETLEDGTTAVSGGTTTSGSHTLPVGTITVVSTTAFPTEGAIVIGGGFHGENGQLVYYTSKNSTQFLGCTGGTGTITTGTRVARFYHRPMYVQSLRNTGASSKSIVKFDIGVDGGNFNVGSGPARNLWYCDESGFYIASAMDLKINGTHYMRPVTTSGPQSLPPCTAWNYDIQHANSGAGMGAAGDEMMVQVPWPVTDTVTNIYLYLTANGTGLTSGQCLAGIHNQSGTLLATTVSQHTNWGAGASKLAVCALTTPTVIPAGTYPNPCIYVSFFWNGSGQPSLLKGISAPPQANGGNVAADKRYCRSSAAATGRTTSLTSNVTMSSRVDSTCSAFWAAVG